ncbi:hypothetical protein B0A52_04799 [Exophiala mesophila]|uniref:RING-type E3 ubiquitin transferase n=1 Tax=Exophiala mesophila TaxID=212818 RepID=A0A438N6F4_EXOME|nr:hypothetical protein B0A52_04799 [Exophiala mesophila]
MPLDANEKHSIGLARDRPQKQSHSDFNNEDVQDSCRICRGEGTAAQPLYYPCKCSGSIKYVHQECLMEWLSHSQKKYCELCKTSFRFTKLYDRSMPANLPIPLFVSQLCRHGITAFSRYARYLVVALIWTCCLPWCIRQIWRGLFWLADGNWLEADDTYTALVNTTNTSSSLATPTSNPVVSDFNIPPSFENVKFVLPPMQFSLADVARLLTSQGLIGRLLQLFLSLILPGSGQATGPPGASDSPYQSFRPPSLLSEVHFIAHWSTSSAINNATIDIVEGQLICISLVTAFILVFLIREWVINQQPNLNIPDADAVEHQNPIPPFERADNLPARQPGRPRAHHRHGNPQDGAGGRADGDPAARPIAVPRARRALTDDNLAFATAPASDVESFHALHRAESTPSTSADPVDHGGFGELGSSSLNSEHFMFAQQTPNNSILVQSQFEVIHDGAEGEHPNPSMHHSRTDDNVGFGQSSAHSAPDEGDSNTNQSILGLDNLSLQDESALQAQDIVYGTNFETAVPTLADMGSDEELVPPAGSSNNDIDTGTAALPLEPRVPDSPSSSIVIATPARLENPIEEASRLQKISAWFWELDENLEPAPIEGANEGHDVEQVVDNVQAEAPFVPNHNREPIANLLPPDPEVLPPAPELPEQNAVFGVDLNDPNAVDDAEDLDGILELLGMEGPLIGMVQNIVFSLFLITVTLSASIWCPYIWGKIALLFILNPVGMLVKAPLFALSRAADIVVDVIFFVSGLAGLVLNPPLRLLRTLGMSVFPAIGSFINPEALQAFTLDLSQKSGTRLEKTLAGAITNLKPDLPSFSMLSHYALRTLRAKIKEFLRTTGTSILQLQSFLSDDASSPRSIAAASLRFVSNLPHIATTTAHWLLDCAYNLQDFVINFNVEPPMRPDFVDDAPVAWSTEDRITTIILGYIFFLAAGVAFLKLAHLVLGLQENEKVEGYFADSLRQTGGVMKVIVIIGIEMLVFPLYCGLLLDIALLPLFADATIASRLAFMARAPFTGIFIHWFIGTCYMFHFALFVSVCRKILRKGVLYFIRDPDDPTFHPVRDVLERPVPTQLGKIAFSALVYGGLVMVCLGGVIWTLNSTGIVFPIQWSTAEPKLSFPIDIVFYNFMLPLFLRKTDPSKKVQAMYKWWFRQCARKLRLSAFLFGEDRPEEKIEHPGSKLSWIFQLLASRSNTPHEGKYVRAPASDSVRIPRGQQVFLDVTEDNQRLDNAPDHDLGIHGKNDERFVKLYLPPHFRARIATFILLLWAFAAITGVTVTIGPLLLGRSILHWLSRSDRLPNDLYAFTVGLHLSAAMAFTAFYARQSAAKISLNSEHWLSFSRAAIAQAFSFVRYVLGLAYLATFTSVVLPAGLAVITELYVLLPLFDYMSLRKSDQSSTISKDFGGRTATIFILQTWTLGILYLRLLLRLFLTYFARDTQAARAIQAIGRNGYMRPDVKLATRALVIPLTVIFTLLLVTPVGFARVAILVSRIKDEQTRTQVYRAAYPGLLGLCLLWYACWTVKQVITGWRIKIRDEVYLIGERLHNFHEPKPEVKILRLGEQT